ncbi:M23 family metallopeptidase [Microlunatus sp. Gsoil 973]|uniref:M23 family metallopeptidase n=1 Tax=Microlunatus sp. Gsoil 973 TaxID=2672569 RepID=UPI0012B45000|nr:M23 family metallopeptidase [Microlunatus sp. Gsoil 973]QGN34469.1 peptidoglycan DD-metalloendopeptidase family protein [Microlunatus sp. Gsoil 973]
MRRLIVLGSVAIAIVVFLPFAGFLTARNVTPTICDGDGISQPIIPGPIPDMPGLTDGQVRLAKIIWLQAHKLSSRLRGPADQAAVIAIAVASQESTLGANPTINRPNADGDAGPFQQRTIPGWYGSLAQVTDPAYGASSFLLGHTVTAEQYAQAITAGTRPAGRTGYHIPGLADVPDWAHIDIIDAADQVQHSAFPDAVADDIPVAREFVTAFDGGSSNSLIADAVGVQPTDPCGDGTHPTGCPPSGSPAEARLKPDTLLVLRCIKQQFPKIMTFYGYRAHDQYPDHPSGRAVDIMISSAYRDFNSPEAVAYGTKIAKWVKAHHAELGVQYIIYRQHIWNIQRASEGWRLMPDRGSPTANHMDHVQVTTYGNAAKPSGPPPKIISGKAVTPVEHYTITATFGEVGSWARYHTGLDFAAPIGTPVRAALAGTITHAGYSGAAGSWAGDYVTIKHADGTRTLYAHMSATNAVVGQSVMTGERVGAIGVTGRSFGPHLHFETYPAGIQPGDTYAAVDPAKWLHQRGVGVGL